MARRNRMGGPSALQHQQWSWVLGVMVGLQQKYGLGGVVEVDELVAQKRLAASSGTVLGLFVCLFVCLSVYFICLFRFGGNASSPKRPKALWWDPSAARHWTNIPVGQGSAGPTH